MRIDRITALGTAILATAGIGLSTAAGAGTASRGVKACVTSHGVLELAGKTGHCPKHTTKVTVAKRGPRGRTGPQGPGARLLTIDTDAPEVSKTITLPAGEKANLKCHNVDNGYGQWTLTVTPPDKTLTRVDGDVYLHTSDSGALFEYSDSEALLTDDNPGQMSIDYAPKGAWSMSFRGAVPETNPFVVVHLFVVRGTSSFTLDLTGRSNYSTVDDSCGASVQFTPAS